MRRKWLAIGGAGAGALGMYLFDPERGSRRRALLGDQAKHIGRVTRRGIDFASRDLAHRVRGLVAKVGSLANEGTVPDGVLAARVRSRVGHLVSHPGSIEVGADQGRVTLSGPVLSSDVRRLLAGVTRVRGVEKVEDWLVVYEEAGGVPGLQGETLSPRLLRRLRRVASPAERLLLLAGGTALLVSAKAARRGLRGALAASGVAAISRALLAGPHRGSGRRMAAGQATDADAPKVASEQPAAVAVSPPS